MSGTTFGGLTLPADFESPNGDYSQSVERFHAFRHTVPVSFGRTRESLRGY